MNRVIDDLCWAAATVLAALLDVLDELPHIDTGVRWQVLKSRRVLLGEQGRRRQS